MLRIRAEQMDALAAASARRFELRAIEHLRRFWPAKVESIGAGVPELVRQTAARCAAAGITAEIDVVRVLHLLMAFGHQPPPPWMEAILDDPARLGGARVDALLARAAEEHSRSAHAGVTADDA